MELKAITFRRQQLVNSSTAAANFSHSLNNSSSFFILHFNNSSLFILHYSHTLISFAVFIIICIF